MIPNKQIHTSTSIYTILWEKKRAQEEEKGKKQTNFYSGKFFLKIEDILELFINKPIWGNYAYLCNIFKLGKKRVQRR